MNSKCMLCALFWFLVVWVKYLVCSDFVK